MLAYYGYVFHRSTSATGTVPADLSDALNEVKQISTTRTAEQTGIAKMGRAVREHTPPGH
jgi:hypothetical protein